MGLFTKKQPSKKEKKKPEDMTSEEIGDSLADMVQEVIDFRRKGIEEAEKALRLGNPQKAAEYYRSISEYEKMEETLMKVGDVEGIIEIYETDKKDDELEKFLIRINDVGLLIDLYEKRKQFGKLGLIYFKKKDYLKAAENFEKDYSKQDYAEKCYRLFGDEKKLADYLERREKRSRFMRITKWHGGRESTPFERNLRVAMAELRRMAEFLKLSNDIRDDASRMYTLLLQRNLLKGMLLEAVVAACIYSACELGNFEISKERLYEASAVSSQELEDAVNLLKKNKIGWK